MEEEQENQVNNNTNQNQNQNQNKQENLQKLNLQNFLNINNNQIINNKLNGNNYNDFIEKMFNENYNYKIEISNLNHKLDQYKADNEKLKNKLKKCILQTDFLEKKLESYKISNGSNSYLFSNTNNMNCSSSFMKQQNDFERLYYEKCEELENFEQNFNKISEKFSDVLSKIQLYQLNLIEDNKRLKEFLIFLLQCFNHKQYEHIICIVNYARENKTFLDKQIFEMPGSDTFKDIEKNYFEKNSFPENIMYSLKDKNEQINNVNVNVKNNNSNINLNNKNEEFINKDNNINNKKFSGYFSTEENEENNLLHNQQQKNKSNKTNKFDYQNLKFSKTVNEKHKLNNKAQSIDMNNNMNMNINMNKNMNSNLNLNSNNKDLIELNVSNNSFNLRNKSPIVTSSTRLNIENEKAKDFSYSSMVRRKKKIKIKI
jgi:hypothetical protein